MNMDSIPLKRQKHAHICSEIDVDIDKCIICQMITEEKTHSSDIGRQRMWEAANIHHDTILNQGNRF